MQNLADLRTWLNNGISENPLMLHGTSVESILELTNSSRLPTCIADDPENPSSIYTQDRLYFSPISSNFRDEKYSELSKMTKTEALKHVRFYARTNAFHNYVASRLKCKNHSIYNIIKDLEDVYRCDFYELKEVQDLFKKEGLNLSLKQLVTLKRDAKKRRGIVIEPDRRILELSHCVPMDDSEAIAVKCPEGLDKRYIMGIKLLGTVEERLIRRFLNGKMKYEGFKTEKPVCHQITYFEI